MMLWQTILNLTCKPCLSSSLSHKKIFPNGEFRTTLSIYTLAPKSLFWWSLCASQCCRDSECFFTLPFIIDSEPDDTQTWQKMLHVFILGFHRKHSWRLIQFIFQSHKSPWNLILNSSSHFFKVFTLVILYSLTAISMTCGFFLLTENFNE